LISPFCAVITGYLSLGIHKGIRVLEAQKSNKVPKSNDSFLATSTWQSESVCVCVCVCVYEEDRKRERERERGERREELTFQTNLPL
jgi:hypothetical protein